MNKTLNRNNSKANLKVKKKNNKNTIKQGDKNPEINNHFYKALSKPFDPRSLGCTVPDPFPFPTVTYHLHQTSVISQASGVTRGSVMFLPNPVLSMVDTWSMNQTIPGSSTGINSTPFNQYATTDGRRCLYGACSPTALSNIFSTYRVVSWGVKISCLQPQLNATGKLIVALLPIGDTVPAYNNLANSVVIGSSVTSITGLPISQIDSSSIIELPTAVQLTVGDLLKGDLEVSGMYTNSNFWSFKSTNLNGSTATSFLGDEVQQASGVVTSIGYKDDTRCVGGCAIVAYWEGVPAGSLGWQFETIYHLEGSPVLSSGVNNIPISSSPPRANIGSMATVESAMSHASKLSNVYEIIHTGMNFLNDNKNILRTGASLLGSML